jgi:hypothetical protein
MVPIRRCGSHALRLRLNFSPDFYSPYPLHLVDFMPLLNFYGDLKDDFNYFQLVNDLIGLQNATMVKWDGVALDPVKVFDAIAERPRSVHTVAWEMLFQAGRTHRAKVVMDKSLDNIYYAEELISLFDDILFLNVVRDPRAQISSINRAIIHDFDVLLNSLTWARAYDTARALSEKYPDRVLTVRYEDFLNNQEQVLRTICQFMGIQFLDSMLDVSNSKEAQRIAALSALWESNSSSPIPANVDKFKKTLTLEEIEIIESAVGDRMAYYGYEPMTDASIEITDAAIERARQQSVQKKAQAWSTLRLKNPRDYQLRRFRADYLGMLKRRLTKETTAATMANLKSSISNTDPLLAERLDTHSS